MINFLALVWRLITGPFVHDSILMLLFSLISYIPSAMIEENSMGTVPMTIRFAKLSIFINILFSAVCILIGLTMY